MIPVDSYAALNELLSGRFTGGTGGAEGEGADETVATPPAQTAQAPAASDDEEDSLIGLLADDVAALWK